MTPKHKRSGAGNLDMPERSFKELPLSEKVKVLNKESKKTKLYAEVAKIYGKNESSILEIVKKEKKCFAVVPQAAKVTDTVCDKCLVKMEKVLNFIIGMYV